MGTYKCSNGERVSQSVIDVRVRKAKKTGRTELAWKTENITLIGMNKLDIKPLSVNEAYTGKRYSTDKLKYFKNSVLFLLENKEIPKGKLEVILEFGFSSAGSDIDNPVKSFLDCLQKKYKVNDNRIYKLSVSKKIIPKGQEYIKYDIKELLTKN